MRHSVGAFAEDDPFESHQAESPPGSGRRFGTEGNLALEEPPVPGQLPIRRLSVAVLDWLVAQGHLEDGWRKRPHAHLDFSSDIFRLATFHPFDFKWGGKQDREDVKKGGHVKFQQGDALPVWKLKTLNLDDNDLTDADFEVAKASTKAISGMVFRNLEILRVKRNHLAFPVLLMPRLRELYLSWNQIVRVPFLAGVPTLEVLVLSHNQVEMLDEQSFKESTQLRMLDLSSNNINIKPSEFYKFLQSLSSNRELVILQLKDNPFCTYFNEYQTLAVRLVPALTRLDDIMLGKNRKLRLDMEKQCQTSFGRTFADVVSEDGEMIPVVSSVDQLPSSELEHVKAFLRSRLGVKVESLAEAKAYFLDDKLAKVDEQVVYRRKLVARAGRQMDTSAARTVTGLGGAQQGGHKAVTFPKITELIKELDVAIADSSNLMTSVSHVYDLASQLTTGTASVLMAVWEGMFEMPPKPGETPALLRTVKEELSATFVQQISILAERYSEARPLLLRTLAKFCPVPKYRLGELAIAALASLARGGGDRMYEVLQVVEEMLVPALSDKGGQNPFGDHAWEALLIGLSKFSIPELADVLGRLVPHLAGFYKLAQGADPPNRPGSALITLMKYAVQRKEHAQVIIEAEEQQLLPSICKNLVSPNGSLSDEKTRDLFEDNLGWCGILQGCMKHYRDQTVQIMLQEKLHRELLRMLSQIRGEKTEFLALGMCKKAAAAIDLITTMMHDQRALKEIMPESSLIPTLLWAPKESSADPLILAASLFCFKTLLNYPPARDKFLKVIVDDLGLLGDSNPILESLKIKRFKELYKRCESHSMCTEFPEDKSGSVTIAAPEFSGAANPHSHKAIISVVEFIRIFSEHATEDLCAKVSAKFNERGRDSLLFKLLAIPSQDVRLAVLRFLESMSPSELDEDEIHHLVGMLDSDSIDQEVSLLASLLETLQRLMEEKAESGDIFRTRYAKGVLEKTFRVLSQNAERNTYGNVFDELQKHILSTKAVDMLLAASQEQLLLRKHLRSSAIFLDFRRIIKYEQLLHSHGMDCVALELTWSGRDIECLLGFLTLTSPEVLSPYRKQGFRIMSRIADVIAGSGDTATNAEERGSQEAEMWNISQMRLDIFSQDDGTFEDQREQQEHLLCFNGLERMMHFIEHRMSTEEPGQGHASGHSVGATGEAALAASGTSHAAQKRHMVHVVEMQRLAQEWLRDLKAQSRSREQERAAETRELKQREEPVKIPLAVEASTEPVIAGEALLHKVFMEEGWKRAADGSEPRRGSVAAPMVPKLLRTEEKFYLNDAGTVVPSYSVAALLRTIFALLTVPVDDSFQDVAVAQLREIAVQMRLLALVEQCGNFADCHLAAKLLRVMSLVLQMQPQQSWVQDNNHRTSLFVGMMFATKCLQLAAPLLESVGPQSMLTPQQLLLAQEAVRLLNTAATAVAAMRLSSVQEVQAQGMELAFARLMPEPVVHSVFLCLLYDMQASQGSIHGPNISDRFVQAALQRRELHNLCTDVLAIILTTCPKTRYDVIELVNSYRIITKHHIHASFMKELMDRAEVRNYRAAMQQYVEEDSGGKAREDIVRCTNVELLPCGGGSIFSAAWGGSKPRRLLLTNQRLLVVEAPSRSQQQDGLGMCPPDRLNPITPTIERVLSLKDLTRVVCATDQQLVILGFLDCSPITGEVVGEQFNAVVCHKSNTRRPLLESLSAMSAPRHRWRVEPTRDMVMDQAIDKRTSSSPVCVTYAINESNGDHLSLFVLTNMEFCEFELHLENWIAPPMEIGFIDSDELAAQEGPGHERLMVQHLLRLAELKMESSSRPGLLAEAPGPGEKVSTFWEGLSAKEVQEAVRQRKKAVQMTQTQKYPAGADAEGEAGAGAAEQLERGQRSEVMAQAQQTVIKALSKVPLDQLRQVAFDSGELPTVSLSFMKFDGMQDEITRIRFLDDVAREQWRRGLAVAIRGQSDHAVAWSRGWDKKARRK